MVIKYTHSSVQVVPTAWLENPLHVLRVEWYLCVWGPDLEDMMGQGRGRTIRISEGPLWPLQHIQPYSFNSAEPSSSHIIKDQHLEDCMMQQMEY